MVKKKSLFPCDQRDTPCKYTFTTRECYMTTSYLIKTVANRINLTNADSWLYNIHHPDNYLLMLAFQKSHHQWPNVWPFHFKHHIGNSPKLLSAIQFLWCQLGKFRIGSTYNPVIDIFLYHHLFAWYVIDNVTRNSSLVI